MRGVSFKPQDIFLRRPLLRHQLSLSFQILLSLDILLHKEVGEAGDFAVQLGNIRPHRLNGRRRALGCIFCVAIGHALQLSRPFARQVEAREQSGKLLVERFLTDEYAVATAALFGTAIVHIPTATFLDVYFARYRATARAALQKSAQNLRLGSRPLQLAAQFQNALRFIKEHF